MYSYKLKSHIDIKLIDHLRFVGDRCADLIANKDIDFRYKKEDLIYVAKVIGYCHDLGKATFYFQQYLLEEGESSDLKNHAHLSALLVYYNLKDFNSELALISYICVLRHHGILKNFTDYMYIKKVDIKRLNKQYKALDGEVKIICEDLNLKFFSQDELEDLLEEIEDEIDEYNDSLNEDNDSSNENDDLDENDDSDEINSLDESNSLGENDRAYKSSNFEIYILIRYLFSVLIYSDKEHAIFKEKNDIEYNIPSTLIDDYKLKKFGKPKSDNIRDIVYEDVLGNISKENNKIMSITLPTGSGKTYACMSSALKLKKELKCDMKIIYSLPFTSIIDQNYEDYKKAIKEIKKVDKVDSQDILKHHYLSSNDYKKSNSDYKDLYYREDKGRFLTHNWNSQIVVTTFIQLFNTLFSNKNTDLIKFNTLANSIVLLDEVQSIPYKYFKVINLLFKEIADKMNTYFIFITATQPLIFAKNEIQELAKGCDDYFRQCKRTQLIIKKEEMDKDEFFEFAHEIINENVDKNILIIVNTIKLSQQLFEYIKEEVDKGDSELIYLSTSIVPKERISRIEKIKSKDKKCIVISTQMVEAGVDIDMDVIIREIAPLDSINQSSGRANRENRGEYLGKIYLVKIKNDIKLLAKYVYTDSILLEATSRVLEDKDVVYEEDFKSISAKYYSEINKNKSDDKSNKLIKSIYRLQFEQIDKDFKLIENQNKVQLFIELDDEAFDVWKKYKKFLKIEDPFDRKNKLESIKSDFYKYVISVFKSKCKQNIDGYIGYVSKGELENTYDIDFGYKAEEESCMIF